jgi:branched-chain amino acid transport system permease protein
MRRIAYRPTSGRQVFQSEMDVAELLQFTFSGLTVGAIYALVAIGFTLIYNASGVANFAQGEFVMLGGMVTFFVTAAGVPFPVAALIAIGVAALAGWLLHRLAIEPARNASPVTLIIITIGVSIFIRGATAIVLDKNFHSLPPLFGNEPFDVGGATLLPQSLVVLFGVAVVLLGLWGLITRTLRGKALLATSANRTAAQLTGINTTAVTSLAFVISAAVGAVGGILVTPITLTYYDAGTMLALKGFAAAVLGGMGNPLGAVVGGLLLGLLEQFSAGYVSSQYKDAVSFIVILLVLFTMPRGLFGAKSVERV